ncbi:MAG TPA: NYN domain-containing protein [Thermoanaerobaculia bacterium]|nr:NYN domain-containing protein [Thermoanaerobaculia bacterium]
MPWIIDGSNVLGSARAATDAKRELVRLLGRFARAKRTRVVCVFDGAAPEHFGTHLGGVSVVFSEARTADDLIVARVANGRGWNVVTSDRALGARIAGRNVAVVEPRRLLAEIESLPATEERGSADDWIGYFSDPKNRNVF